MVSPEEIEQLVRNELKNMKSYTPIEPTDVLSQRVDIPVAKVIKLDGNENPYGCSEKVKRALADYAYYHHYPDPEQRELRKALEKYIGVGADQIIAGSGSDELIDLILRLFVEPGAKVINCPPTFGMYPFSTDICGGRTVSVPRKADFSIDLAAVKKAKDKRTKIIFVASPNNPSGNITSETEIIALLDTGIVVVVDEAYAEFSGLTLIPLVTKYNNLIVLRTFSKWAGLAGLRVGYGIFPENIFKHLMKIKQPYNVNIAAQIAALESLKDIEYLRSTVKAIINERERLSSKLSQLNWLKVYPSQANFILCTVLNEKAKRIHQELQGKGIFVRYFDTMELKDCLRISVGKPEHTDALIAALKEIC
ncbi:MAG: histidinol-phosphate transaminase [Chloroflexi bacterium]|nr:histidinol-phosphate transaminase [Chloroflexota bacterium]MBM4452050.1 histidinol-phosphate transaminase [Chloroflexota bacterium]MBM4454161.1 histidinol-phosphate transaminase [Chloroflexota bacterium]